MIGIRKYARRIGCDHRICSKSRGRSSRRHPMRPYHLVRGLARRMPSAFVARRTDRR